MITFKQFLDEARMTKSVFSSAIERLGDAKLGYELEMWVPETSGFLIVKDEEYIGDFKKTAEEAKASLEDYLGVDVVVGNSDDKWKIVPDGSVQGPDNGVGIEVVSPPLPVADALDDLKSCFRWMEKNDLETNSSTGIHINLSIPGLKQKLDPLKLILFMGEAHVLKSYAREANTFATKHYNDLISGIQKSGRPPKDAKQLIDLASEMLQSAKYRTVNLSKLSQGYLEFRTGGNDNYHKKYKQIESDVGRFLTVLELACDPDADRQEYLKKVGKLFDAAKTAKTQPPPGYYAVSKPGSLEALIGPTILNLFKANIHGEDYKRATERLRQIMDSTGHAIASGQIDEVSVKAIAEFKVWFSRLNKGNPGVLKQIQDDASAEENENIKAFVKAFNLK